MTARQEKIRGAIVGTVLTLAGGYSGYELLNILAGNDAQFAQYRQEYHDAREAQYRADSETTATPTSCKVIDFPAFEIEGASGLSDNEQGRALLLLIPTLLLAPGLNRILNLFPDGE